MIFRELGWDVLDGLWWGVVGLKGWVENWVGCIWLFVKWLVRLFGCELVIIDFWFCWLGSGL